MSEFEEILRNWGPQKMSEFEEILRNELFPMLAKTGGSVSLGYTPTSVDQSPRWEVVVTYGNPGGRDTRVAVGVGSTVDEAMEKAITTFRAG